MFEQVIHTGNSAPIRSRNASARSAHVNDPDYFQHLGNTAFPSRVDYTMNVAQRCWKNTVDHLGEEFIARLFQAGRADANALAAANSRKPQTHGPRLRESSLRVSRNRQFESAALRLADKSDNQISKFLRGQP